MKNVLRNRQEMTYRTSKPAGNDDIPIDLLKTVENEAIKVLTIMCHRVCKKE